MEDKPFKRGDWVEAVSDRYMNSPKGWRGEVIDCYKSKSMQDTWIITFKNHKYPNRLDYCYKYQSQYFKHVGADTVDSKEQLWVFNTVEGMKRFQGTKTAMESEVRRMLSDSATYVTAVQVAKFLYEYQIDVPPLKVTNL